MVLKNKSWLVAVSGGPDSMALLDIYKKKIKAVIHVNYQKRHDSDHDQQIVENFCNKNNIPLYIKKVTTSDYENIKNTNFQTKARIIRYDFFLEIANKLSTYQILIAHNFTDFLETAYMQLENKSMSLFYGIEPKSSYKNLIIYRPLILISKKRLLNYCKENDIKFATDYTNEQDIYSRNKVRKIINQWSKDEIFSFKKKIISYNKKNRYKRKKITNLFQDFKATNYDVDFLLKLNDTYKYYLLYLFFKEFDINRLSKIQINNIINFLSKKSNKQYRIKNKNFLSISKNKIVLINNEINI